MARYYHRNKKSLFLKELRILRKFCKHFSAVKTSLYLKLLKLKLKLKVPIWAATGHWGTLIVAGMIVKLILVQSCEQHQREDLSALPILERWAQGVSVQGLALRNTFQL